MNLAPPCGIGLRQTDINGHIADRLLRIGDGSTSSSNLSLNLSNDSCGLHQPNGAHTSQFPGDIHEWLLNESSHDSNAALREFLIDVLVVYILLFSHKNNSGPYVCNL